MIECMPKSIRSWAIPSTISAGLFHLLAVSFDWIQIGTIRRRDQQFLFAVIAPHIITLGGYYTVLRFIFPGNESQHVPSYVCMYRISSNSSCATYYFQGCRWVASYSRARV